MSEFYVLTLEHDGKKALTSLTKEAICDADVVGRVVTARLIPMLHREIHTK